ncbi:MAG: hypothetical protein JRH11_07870 [Deltaproteobacteria bacterium]|nr:hypothetical protein [Deltaproteobacteria bacterium]
MHHLIRWSSLLALVVSGCTTGGPDSGGLPPAPSCEGMEPLELGRCIDTITGEDCTGQLDEEPRFESLMDGGPLSLVTGPQGSSMFVVAVRTEGIDGGNPDQPTGVNNPLVEITVVDGAGESVAVLRRYSAFSPDPTRPGSLFNGGFFVVIDDLCRHGEELTAVALLEDANGDQRCGQLTFVADCGI